MTNVTKVDGGYLHEWIDADGEHHKYVHPTSLTHPAPSGQAVALPSDEVERVVEIANRNEQSVEGDRLAVRLSAISNPSAQPGWRSMDSAPKDGTDILAWSKDDQHMESIRYELYDDETAAEVGEPGYWRYSEDLIADVAEAQEKDFSHWMPRPAAPLPGGAK